jgi:hypothetical protein
MSDQQNALFDPVALTPSEITIRPVGGRPKGSKNKSPLGWRIAQIATPDIMRQVVTRALRLEDDGDIRCAEIVLNRTMPRPKTPAIQLDVSQAVDARSLLALVADGQMSPADFASVWNSVSRNGLGAKAAGGELSSRRDMREQIAERMAKIVAARAAAAATVVVNGDGGE